MTLKKAERIMHLEVRQLPRRDRLFLYAAYRDEEKITEATDKSASRALERLVQKHYEIQCRRVRREQHNRCFACGRLTQTQTDHVIPRGMGGANRDDRRENLRAVCEPCHAARHSDGKVLEPHPKILEYMAKVGLRWGGNGWLALEKAA